MNNSVYITRISSFLPNSPVDNDKIEDVLGYIGGKKSRAKSIVLKSNGIKQRYYILDPKTRKPLYSNASMTAKAVESLIDKTVPLSSITCLACGTTTPDYLMPNHALITQGELGLTGCEAIATSGICLSGITAMKYACMAISCGEHKRAVCTGSEVVSLMMKAEMFEKESKEALSIEEKPELAFGKDFLRWMLSDGAGAMLLEANPNTSSISLKVNWIDILSYAGEMPTCMVAGAYKTENGFYQPWKELTPVEFVSKNVFAIEQDVKLLNENIIPYTVEKPLKEVVEKYKLNLEDIDFFLPHYSSEYFRDKLLEGMKNVGFEIPQNKWFTNLTTNGNTGSASIYIILEELFNSGKLSKGQKLLCYIPESGRFSSAFMLLEVV